MKKPADIVLDIRIDESLAAAAYSLLINTLVTLYKRDLLSLDDIKGICEAGRTTAINAYKENQEVQENISARFDALIASLGDLEQIES